MDSSTTKPKNQRATHEQLETYVSFCRAHPEIGRGKNTPKSPRQMQDLWRQLAEQLNACRGPSRTAAKWKETMGVWKSQLRTRARRLKMEQRLTGGGPCGKPLTNFEQKSLAAFGSVAVDGVETIESFGLGLPRKQIVESSIIECPISSTESRLPSSAPLPSLLLSPTPLPSPNSLPSFNALPSPGPLPSPNQLPSPNPLPSPGPLPSPNSAQSPYDSPLFSPDKQIDTDSDARTSRPSRGERNKLISSLIANIAKRNAAEEHRQHREEEQRREHREVIHAIHDLTRVVAELINVLKQNSGH
ncbi:myb-related transcription factor, partner of profilin-like [Bactrocera dorsalis]|uniref:Regulatory protein zeste n=1 Tax=Bactrocera dorsalis TaxID=27457 RepID=A0ABM3IYV6_BACDO|nr:myb-related transcription factor, partner of profilin-like [Bactrocera dorsalis]